MEKLRRKLPWRNHREYQQLLFENFQIALLVFSADLKVPARGKQKKEKMNANNEWPLEVTFHAKHFTHDHVIFSFISSGQVFVYTN